MPSLLVLPASLVANWGKMEGSNPRRPGERPRSGPISHAFAPSETLPAFLWVSLREGLLVVISK